MLTILIIIVSASIGCLILAHLINCGIEDLPVFPRIHSYRISKQTYYGDTPIRISFKQFQKFYAIAPRKWAEMKRGGWVYEPSSHKSNVLITATNFIEFLRIRNWWKRQNRKSKANNRKWMKCAKWHDSSNTSRQMLKPRKKRLSV